MIKLNNVSKEYVGKKTKCMALKNITIDFGDTGLVIINGRSGSGKTTLLNLIAGIDKPTLGEVNNSYNSNDFYSFAFQDFQLINYLTIEENLKLVKNFSDEINDFKTLIEKYDLSDILNNYPNEISGGQKQRVAILRAILMERPVMLCDEPTGNLDEENAAIVVDMLKDLSEYKLVIVVTHDLEIFDGKYDRLIKISKGEIKEDINNNVILNSNDKTNCSKFIFTPKAQMNLMKKFMQRNKLRYILMFIPLALSIFLLFAAINLAMNQDYVVIANNYKAMNIPVQFAKYSSDEGAYYSTNKSELENLMNKYDCSTYYYHFDSNISFDELSIYRIYVSNKCNKKILYGTDELKDDNIIISDYSAQVLSNDIKSLIGTKLKGYIISGIFETNYKTYSTDSDNNYIYYECDAVYINKNSLIDYIGYDQVYSKCMINGKLEDVLVYNNKNTEILYGDNIEVEDNEIGLSKAMALSYSNDLSGLIGQNVTISFANRLQRGNDESAYEDKKTYKVKYIYDSALDYEISISNNTYTEIAVDISRTFNDGVSNGLSFDKCNKALVKSLVDKGFKDHTYKSSEIEAGIGWADDISLIAMGVGVIMLIISMFVLIHFIHSIFSFEKRTMGVLVSFGIPKACVTKMYFLTITFITGISYILSVISNIFVMIIINKVIKKLLNLSAGVVYYNAISILLVILPIVVILLIMLLIIRKKMKKKTIVDIIYER